MKRMFIFLFLFGCATHELTPTGLNLITESEYEKTLDKYSDRIETYNGLYNSLQASASLVNTPVAIAQIDQNARLYQWEQEKFNSERLLVMEKLSKETDVFLSFYVPDKKHDDLSKSNSMWKLFLDANGKRYEGKATKLKLQTVEVQGLFPSHNRFSTPYMISFPVSVKTIENYPSKLILTGPAGFASLKFSPAQ